MLFFAFCGALIFSEGAALAQPAKKTVKIFGAGGLRGLEAYQTGILISGEGHILTTWSYVLDPSGTRIVTDSGERFDAKLVGYDPALEIAVLKADARGLPFFDLSTSVEPKTGSSIRAWSNCYGVATGDESVSVQQGTIAAMTNLNAKRGTWQVPWQGKVCVLDAITSNPGTSGGIITTTDGKPVALIGKESRDRKTGSWLNYAIPFSELNDPIQRLLKAKPELDRKLSSRRSTESMTPTLLGFSLVADVVGKTPPFVEFTTIGGAAQLSGVTADDLIVDINGFPVASCKDVRQILARVDRDAPVKLTLQRQSKFVTAELSLVQQ